MKVDKCKVWTVRGVLKNLPIKMVQKKALSCMMYVIVQQHNAFAQFLRVLYNYSPQRLIITQYQLILMEYCGDVSAISFSILHLIECHRSNTTAPDYSYDAYYK